MLIKFSVIGRLSVSQHLFLWNIKIYIKQKHLGKCEKKRKAWPEAIKPCLLIFVANDYLKNPGHNEQGQQYKQEKVDGIQKITELIMVRETASRWD